MGSLRKFASQQQQQRYRLEGLLKQAASIQKEAGAREKVVKLVEKLVGGKAHKSNQLAKALGIGSAGVIGGHLVRGLTDPDWDVYSFDRQLGPLGTTNAGEVPDWLDTILRAIMSPTDLVD